MVNQYWTILKKKKKDPETSSAVLFVFDSGGCYFLFVCFYNCNIIQIAEVSLKGKIWNVSFCTHSSFLPHPSLRWKNVRPLSADGNYRPLSKTRQQQNVSMRRQENLRWMSEVSYVEEKEQWQEQINQLKKQLEFSVSICQTLMQDQQVGMKS